MSVFKNYELKMAAETICKSRDEAIRVAADYFMVSQHLVYAGREEARPEGIIIELFDLSDGAQEDPFFCIIRP